MKECLVPSCSRPHYALGLCALHWRRQRRHGTTFPEREARKGAPLGRSTQCAADNCAEPVKSRGWCRLHYDRWLRYGQVFADRPSIARVPLTLAEKPPLQRERPCSLEGCDKAAYVRGMCQMHYQRSYKKGDPLQQWAKPRQSELVCSVADCHHPASVRGWCKLHYGRWQRHGDPTFLTRNEPGKGSTGKNGYRRIGDRFEHRIVMERMIGRPLLPDESVHHRNGNRADNRPANLELWASPHQAGQRVEDQIRAARALLAQYEPIVDKLP